MNRLQNILLALWALVMILFAVFNWDLVWREEPIVPLIREFRVPWLFWFGLAALLMPLVFRGFSWAEARRAERRAEHEITAIKARAFDNRDQELESLAQRIQERIESSLKAGAAQRGPDPMGGGAKEKEG